MVDRPRATAGSAVHRIAGALQRRGGGAEPVAGTGDEVVDEGVVARLGAVGDTELAIDVGEVELDRLLCHPQLAGDPGVRMALDHPPERLELTSRERAVGCR